MRPASVVHRGRSSRRRRLGIALLVALALIGAGLAIAASTPEGRALRNVAGYQLRKAWWARVGAPELDPDRLGSLSGVVVNHQGKPIADAEVLVATVRGEKFQARSDANGLYRIENVPAGRYVPMAGAWGFDTANGRPVRVRAQRERSGVDFALSPHVPAPVEPADLHIGQPRQESSNFPEPMVATRIPFSFTLDGVTIDNGQIYLPAATTDRAPTLVIIYPSHPLNWNAASVALTRNGNPILAVGPDGDRGLDMAGHVRDYRAALRLWQDGLLTPLGTPGDDWVAMSGSFSSLILFPALRDLERMPPAIVSVGAVSDAFLGVQALYDANLAIPPPYDSAVAAMGRPDKDPAFFYGFSPVYFADKLPPIFVVHTYDDEVIPYNQAEAFDRALNAAGVPHELLLYEDTTHYLDAYDPTPGTHLVYERVLSFVANPLTPP